MREQSKRLKALVLLGGILLFIGLSYYFNIGVRLRELKDWFQELGHLGPLAFIATYVLATLLAVPGTILTVVAGIVFGAFWGTIYVSIAATIGAAGAFIIARYLGREYVESWLAESEKFRRLDLMTEKYDSLIVAITRLLPIFPYNIMNFAFGLTRVHFWTYIIWSWICMLPLTVLYIVGSDVLGRAIMHGEWHEELIFIFFALLAFIILLGGYVKHYIEGEERKENSGDKIQQKEERIQETEDRSLNSEEEK